MEDRLERRAPWVPWAIGSVVLLAVAVIAFAAGAHTNAGVAAVGPGERPWHFHPFGFLWLIVLFWFIGGMRWMLWGAWWGGPWRYRRRYGHPGWREFDREDFEDWHRREHERMNTPRPPYPPADGSQRPV
jgi:hypothetical protein